MVRIFDKFLDVEFDVGAGMAVPQNCPPVAVILCGVGFAVAEVSIDFAADIELMGSLGHFWIFIFMAQATIIRLFGRLV